MKGRRFGVLSITGTVLLLTACRQGKPTPVANSSGETRQATVYPAPTGDAANGNAKFQSTCVACHGVGAKGIPNLGKDLTTSAFVKAQSDAELVAFLKRGRPVTDKANTTGVEMPARGGNSILSDHDLADIVAYIRSLSR